MVHPVSEVVERLTSSLPAGSALTFRHINAPPRVQRRVAGAEKSEDLIRRARSIRQEEGTPFWHALFLLGEDDADGVPIDIVKSALFHQDPANDVSRTLQIDDSLQSSLAAWVGTISGRDAIALDSEVLLADGSSRFIPMIDFSVKSSKLGGDATARACVEALGVPGYLVTSGRSYHFYGEQLVDSAGQLDFWSKALLLTPMVDERWIAHQIRSGRSALRVTPNEKGDLPGIIWEVDIAL